jgi:UDP-N-acetylglucosamine acyltransferase
VRIGPFCVVGENVELGDGTTVASHAVLDGWTTIGRECQLGVGVVIGAAPQDRKYTGARSYVRIGDRNVVREYTSIHRATDPEGATVLGHDNFVMANAHIAHNCEIGNHVTITNLVGLSGYIIVDDYAWLAGMTAYHQHIRIGAYAFVGGGLRVVMDVVPFAMAAGDPLRIYGLNREGLKRNGFSNDQQRVLKAAYRLMFWSGLTMTAAVARLKADMGNHEHVARLVRFAEASKRGLTPGIQVGNGDHGAHAADEGHAA